MPANDKILSRIKKILAIANDAAASDGERETAMQHAYKLLEKHNLDLSDLPDDEVVEQRVMDEMTLCGDKWVRSVAQAMGILFFCEYFFMRTRTSGKEVHYFVGRESNVLTAKYMTDFVRRNIQKEASRRYSGITTPAGRSFAVGATDIVCVRVRKIVSESEAVQSESTGSSLVVADMRKLESEANDDYLNSRNIKLKTSNRATRIQVDAYDSGKAHGENINLNLQVGATVRKTKQITN